MERGYIQLIGKQSFRTGIDLVGNTGSNILNVKSGQVTWAGWQNEYGNCVEVQHIGDEGKIFNTFYAHSTGDHLHFEIRLEDKRTIEPVEYLFEII